LPAQQGQRLGEDLHFGGRNKADGQALRLALGGAAGQRLGPVGLRENESRFVEKHRRRQGHIALVAIEQRVPISYSRSRICWLSEGCAVRSVWAARVKLSASATATK
jgi:hypothetical protein